MIRKLKFFAAALTIISITFGGSAHCSVLKSLDDELTSLVEKTEPYLVTVKGKGTWRNLIATGIVYDKTGHVITSSHVYNADEFEVTFKDGAAFSAEKIGVDNQTGLAVLKIGGDDLKPPKWESTSELRDGAWIMVVGNSFGIPATVNIGTFSEYTGEGFLQLNVDVRPGASGGAVLNTDGKIVGILIAREVDSGFSFESSARDNLLRSYSGNLRFFDLMRKTEGRAIAIPIDMVTNVVAQLIATGEVRRGFLGISQKNLAPDERAEYNLEGGIKVIDVVEESPAEEAGLEEGDIITAVEDKPIQNTYDLFNMIRSHRPGDKIKITYYRGGEEQTTEATLETADDTDLFGKWKVREIVPKLNVDNRLLLPDMTDLKEEISRLGEELKHLRDELEKLQDRLEE
jgi:S1-C subfamily serine protease